MTEYNNRNYFLDYWLRLHNCHQRAATANQSLRLDWNRLLIPSLMILHFDHTAPGLMVGDKSGILPVKEVKGGTLKRFAISDGKGWHWANAKIGPGAPPDRQ